MNTGGIAMDFSNVVDNPLTLWVCLDPEELICLLCISFYVLYKITNRYEQKPKHLHDDKE